MILRPPLPIIAENADYTSTNRSAFSAAVAEALAANLIPHIAPTSATMTPKPSRDGLTKTYEGTHRILVVDDDVNLTRLLRTILRTAGYDVVSRTDGFEALDLLAQEHFDAVILDLRMPRIDGRTLFRQLRGSGNKVPVLIASAYGARSAQLELGAEGSIEKPFDPDSLVEAVEQLLPATRSSSQ